MRLEIRPTTQNLVINYIVTLGILVVIVYLSLGNPGKYYYSPRYNDHMGYYGGEMDCNRCHTSAFSPVPNEGCANSGCHAGYQPDIYQFRDVTLYDVDWVSVNAKNPEALLEKRQVNASLAYHHMTDMKEMACIECHKTHTPPPEGLPIAYDHAKDTMNAKNCFACHGYNQAPPILAHHEMLSTKSGKCYVCHLNGNSWNNDVEWVGKPADRPASDARLVADASGNWVPMESIINGGTGSIPATPVSSITPTPAPTPSDIEPTPTPDGDIEVLPTPDGDIEVLPTPTPLPSPTPTPTPSPTPELDRIDWTTFWRDYEPGMDLTAHDEKPVLLMFTHTRMTESNKFEIYFERSQGALHYIKENMTPVRVDWSRYKQFAYDFGIPTAPALVRLDKNGMLIDRQLFRGRVSERQLMSFLKAEVE